LFVVIVEPVSVDKLINCEVMVDAFRLEPVSVDKLINCEVMVDAFRVETVNVEFTT